MVILWPAQTKAVSDGRQPGGAQQQLLALFATTQTCRELSGHGVQVWPDNGGPLGDLELANSWPSQAVTFSRGAAAAG